MFKAILTTVDETFWPENQKFVDGKSNFLKQPTFLLKKSMYYPQKVAADTWIAIIATLTKLNCQKSKQNTLIFQGKLTNILLPNKVLLL